jgi:hypothetical protein
MEQLATYNLLAAYSDLSDGRNMLDELHSSGISHDELSLVTREGDADLPTAPQPEDEVGDTARTAVTGVATGGAVGGTLGAIAGIATVGLPGIGVAIGAGAIFAAAAGGVLATQSTEDEEAWKQRVAPVLGLVRDGYVILGVHTDDGDRAAKAEEILGASHPHRLERVDTSEEPYDGT